ncbi:Rpn family recombination-promoting nuclease/putative transposase [Parabacteroides sp.]
MNKFINPFSDYGFKLIFGSEINKDLIISFLNGVLHDEVIVNITFRNVEMLGMKQDQRHAVFDIFCENEKGEFFIVEMQKARQKFFSDRILYYASFAIQQQSILAREKMAHLQEEERHRYWDYNINKVYIVCILNYVMEPNYPEKYRWDIVRMDRDLKIPFSETLNEVYLEMPKFILPLSECKTIYLKWLYVLNNIDIMERLPEELNNQLFQKLKSIVEIERMSANERLEYELSLAVERDLLCAFDAKFEDGLKEGRKEGFEEGMKKVARKCKSTDMPTGEIVKLTGLSPEEIEQL